MERTWNLHRNRRPSTVPGPARPPRRRLVAAAAAALLGLAMGPPAGADETGVRQRGRLVDVRILVDGAPTMLYGSSRGDARRYFEAKRGERYAIELRNRSTRRLGVLIAVDGLNIITGTRSGLDAHESFYVLGPRERTVIRGWRTSLHDIRQFVFVDEERSYAERTGQANADMGWIHVLTFEENLPVTLMGVHPGRSGKPSLPPTPQADASRGGAPTSPEVEGESRKASPGQAPESYAGRRRADEAGAFPGTGWGEHRRDHVEATVFDPVEHPVDHLVFRYEYEAGLRALGLLPTRHRLDEREHGEFGFASPPRW